MAQGLKEKVTYLFFVLTLKIFLITYNSKFIAIYILFSSKKITKINFYRQKSYTHRIFALKMWRAQALKVGIQINIVPIFFFRKVYN